MRFGLRSILAMGVLLEAVPSPAPGGGGGGAPPAPAPAPQPGQPFAVFESQQAFNERMERAQRSHLREIAGTESPDELRARLARLTELENAENERKRNEMTELQRVQTDLAAAREATAAAQSALEGERFASRVSGECARLGIRNVRYAQYEVGQARQALPEAQRTAFDPAAHLEGLMAKPEYKTAFGIEAAPTQVPQPVSTSPQPPVAPPAPAAPGGSPPAAVDAMSMSPSEFRAHLEKIGAGGVV